jgi:hypothetical protein
MKMSLYLFMILVLGVFKISSQNPDVAVSYVARELQIHLAKEYEKEVKKSMKEFRDYAVLNTGFYYATQGTRRPSSSSYNFKIPANPCTRKWDPVYLPINTIKLPMWPFEKYKCKLKINLLDQVALLVNNIQRRPTLYSPKSAVLSRIVVKTNAILKNIDIELLKHY